MCIIFGRNEFQKWQVIFVCIPSRLYVLLVNTCGHGFNYEYFFYVSGPNISDFLKCLSSLVKHIHFKTQLFLIVQKYSCFWNLFLPTNTTQKNRCLEMFAKYNEIEYQYHSFVEYFSLYFYIGIIIHENKVKNTVKINSHFSDFKRD